MHQQVNGAKFQTQLIRRSNQMAINKAVAGQAKLDLFTMEGTGAIRIVGTGTTVDGDTIRIDRRGSYTDKDNSNYVELTEAQMDIMEGAKSIAAALLAGFESGDIEAVKAELLSERTAIVAVEEPKVIEK